MARTKQTARKSTGGKAPRKQLATRGSQSLRAYMTSQQTVGQTVRADAPSVRTSYLNHENVIGSFGFEAGAPTDVLFAPRFGVATVPHPQTGLDEQWLSLQFASKLDGDGFSRHGRPPLRLVLCLDISGSMASILEGDDDEGGGSVPMGGGAGASGAAPPFRHPFSFFAPLGKSKLDAAKRCVAAILPQLGEEDDVGVLLFNHETHVLHPPGRCTAAAKADIVRKLEAVRPGGGTRLAEGFKAGMAALSSGKPSHPLQRVYFLTDMQSHASDEVAVLDEARSRARSREYTTIVGMGVDLSVGTVEAVSTLPGGKYLSVFNAAEFERSVGAEFAHDVTPIAFGIKGSLHGGWAIERACGSAELNSLAPGAVEFEISSEFASSHGAHGEASGGMILFKLRPPTEAAAAAPAPPARRGRSAADAGCGVSSTSATAAAGSAGPSPELRISMEWQTTGWEASLDPPRGKSPSQGKSAPPAKAWPRAKVPPPAARGTSAHALAIPPSAPPSAAPRPLRKALALTRFVDLQGSFCDAPDDEGLQARLARLAGYVSGRAELVREMRDLGDASLEEGGANSSFLQTLDQIIEMETAETGEMAKALEREQAAAAAAAAADANPRTRSQRKRAATRGAGGGAAGGAAAALKRSRRQPAAEYLCPITKQVMSDPVSTADGHSFDRSAIAQWLLSNNSSPLTGLPLEHKHLTPNHSLRSMIRAFTDQQ